MDRPWNQRLWANRHDAVPAIFARKRAEGKPALGQAGAIRPEKPEDNAMELFFLSCRWRVLASAETDQVLYAKEIVDLKQQRPDLGSDILLESFDSDLA